MLHVTLPAVTRDHTAHSSRHFET